MCGGSTVTKVARHETRCSSSLPHSVTPPAPHVAESLQPHIFGKKVGKPLKWSTPSAVRVKDMRRQATRDGDCGGPVKLSLFYPAKGQPLFFFSSSITPLTRRVSGINSSSGTGPQPTLLSHALSSIAAPASQNTHVPKATSHGRPGVKCKCHWRPQSLGPGAQGARGKGGWGKRKNQARRPNDARRTGR